MEINGKVMFSKFNEESVLGIRVRLFGLNVVVIVGRSKIENCFWI